MYSGVGVSKGISSGKLCLWKDSRCTYERKSIENVELEKEYVTLAFQKAIEELDELYQLAKENVGTTIAMIVQGHRLMIEDKGGLEKVLALIEKQSVNAEWAIQEIFQQYIQVMKESEDTYLRARAADFQDILKRLERTVLKEKGIRQSDDLNSSEAAFIAIGRQFSVEDILVLYKAGAIGLLDLAGDEESHALTVAKSLDIPMILQVNNECLNLIGHYCTMDGMSGSVKDE